MENVRFTMSYKQFRDLGIPWKSLEKVRDLPANEPLIAICGIWGEPANLRCVFETENGRLLMRQVYWRDEYLIKELGISGKALETGKTYWVGTKSGISN